MSGVHDSDSVSNTDRVASPSENLCVLTGKKPILIISHSSSSGDDDPATSIRQTLAAEQPTEANTPSHAFARTTTAATREWSMRSNESLFSLHTGNPSFTTEQLNWMSKSGEFYFYNDSPLCSPLPPGTPWNNMSAAEFASRGGVIGLDNESLFSIHTGNMSLIGSPFPVTPRNNQTATETTGQSGEFYFYNDSPLCSPLPPGTPWNNLSAAEFASRGGVIGLDNELLFSIHTGNMSLIGSPFPVTPLNNQTATETTRQSGDSNEGRHGDTEAEATNTTRKKESRVRKVNVHKELSLSHPVCDVHQDPSDASVKSFAFPILIGDSSENGSPPQSTEKQSQQECSTPRTPETLSETANETQTTPETPKLGWPNENTDSPSGKPKPQTPKATRNGGPKKWLGCFSCCTASPTSATS